MSLIFNNSQSTHPTYVSLERKYGEKQARTTAIIAMVIFDRKMHTASISHKPSGLFDAFHHLNAIIKQLLLKTTSVELVPHFENVFFFLRISSTYEVKLMNNLMNE